MLLLNLSMLSRSILKSDIHQIVYFILLVISFCHITLQLDDEEYFAYSIFKWTDPMTYVNLYIGLYIILALCLISSVPILLVLCASLLRPSSKIETTVLQHYLTKLPVSLAFVLSHAICYPLAHCTFAQLTTESPVSKALAIVTVVLYFGVVYPYSTLLLTDLSPYNHRTISSVTFPNCLTLLNIYRPISAFLAVSGCFRSLLVVSASFFALALVFLFRCPVISWKHNQYSRIYLSMVLWSILFRLIKVATASEASTVFYMLGLLCFVFVVKWLAHKRVTMIIEAENSPVKLKVLYFLLINKQRYEKELSNFILSHYRKCSLKNCFCRQILENYQKQKLIYQNNFNQQQQNNIKKSVFKKSGFNIMNKLKLLKNNPVKELQKINSNENEIIQNKKQERILWFEFLSQLQSELIDFDCLRGLSSTKRRSHLAKVKDILLDLAENLHYELDRQYQSLRCLWLAEEAIGSEGWLNMLLAVRLHIEQTKQEQTIQKKSKEEGSNQYALNFFELQSSLNKFRKKLFRAVSRAQKFWSELVASRPKQEKIIMALEELARSRREVMAECQQHLRRSGGESYQQNSSEYLRSWKAKIANTIEDAFLPFAKVMNIHHVPSSSMSSLAAVSASRPEDKTKIEKNIKFYNERSLTGMGIVNIQEGDSFGCIEETNKDFWRVLSCTRYDKPHINHFLAKEMHEYHNKTMVQFLQRNKHFLNFHRGFVIGGDKLLVEIEFSVQLLPHLARGLHAAVFLQVSPATKPILLVDKMANIIAYNLLFKQRHLASKSLKDFDEVVTKQFVIKLELLNEHSLFVSKEEFGFRICHSVEPGDENESLFFCEVSLLSAEEEQSVYEEADVSLSLNKSIDPTRIMSDFNSDTTPAPPANNAADSDKSRVLPTDSEADKGKDKLAEKLRQENKSKLSKVSYIFDSISCEKPSSKVRRWKCFSAVMFILLSALSIIASGLTYLKNQSYYEATYSLTNLTQCINFITQTVYLSRQVNVLSFNNLTSFQELQQKSQKLNELQQQFLTCKTNINLAWWDVSFKAFQFTKIGLVQQKSNTTFQMIIQKYFLSDLTTFNQQMNYWNFDYILMENSLPYTSAIRNFYQMSANSYYIILPNIIHEFRTNVFEVWQMKILVPRPVTPLFACLVIVSYIFMLVTIVFSLKIYKIFFKILKILQNLDIAKINQRLINLQNYSIENFQDLQQIKNVSKLQPVIDKNTEEKAENDLNNLTDNQTDFTARQLQQKSSFQFGQLIKNSKNQSVNIGFKKVPAKFRQQGFIKVIIKILLGCLPLIILGSASIAFQINFNKLVWKHVVNLNMIHKKIQYINLIKSQSYEFGYQLDQFKVLNNSIVNQLYTTIDKAYQITRQIQSNLGTLEPQFISYVNNFNKMTICQILIYISNTENVKICSQQQQIYLYGKSWSEVLVDYLQTTRTLLSDYKGLNLSTQKQRQFMRDVRHDKISMIHQHLMSVESHIQNSYRNIQFQFLAKYKLTIISISLSMIPLSILIWIFWGTRQLKSMNNLINNLKIMSEIIQMSQVSSNEQLKQNILSNQKNFYFII